MAPCSALLAALVLTSACSAPLKRETAADKTTPPKLGACYRLAPKDTDQASNATTPVSCSEPHTSETFAIGTLPAETGKSYSSAAHGRWIYPTCEQAFEKFLAVDESLAMRVQLSWAWFRPSRARLGQGRAVVPLRPGRGARRGDVVPRPAHHREGAVPGQAAGGVADLRQGPTVLKSKKLPCTEPHDWRAVTTIKLGEPEDPYPGDRLVQVRSRDFCSDSVGAWMNYPVNYEFGYTWFHEAEWKAGNRRAVCWARTDR